MVRIQAELFDPGDELNAFAAQRMDVGAIVSFTGVVRDDTGDLQALEIEHYPAMTETAIVAMVEEAQNRWGVTDALVVHRYGALRKGEVIMMVATAARHRREAFEAAEFLMDYLKSRAPFWKKEIGSAGAEWVRAKDDDEDALGRWSK